MKPHKKRTPQPINHLVNKLMKRWQSGADQKKFLFDHLWKKIVGTTIAEHSMAQQINYGKLVVLVENSAWMNELTFMKETIKIKANSLFGEHHVEVIDIVFKLGYNRHNKN